MATKYISDLTAVSNLSNSDTFIVDDGAHNYKIAFQALKALLNTVSSLALDPENSGKIILTTAAGQTFSVTPHDPDKQDNLTFDQTPTQNSGNPVTSGGTKAALDEKLNANEYKNFTGASGENPGSAGIVPGPAAEGMYLGSEGAWITPDSTPTDNSTNLPTSGGVKAALDGKLDATDYVVDPALDSTSENPVQNAAVAGAIETLSDDQALTDAYQKLLSDDLPNTVQTYTFAGGSISQVTHRDVSDSSIVRTDTFTFGEDSITEVRVLSTGEKLTRVTNTASLVTTTTYTES